METEFSIDRIDYPRNNNVYMLETRAMRGMFASGAAHAHGDMVSTILSPRPKITQSDQYGRSIYGRTFMASSKNAFRHFTCYLRCWLTVLAVCMLIRPSKAVLIEYQNCLSDAYLNSDPTRLQFVPNYVDAVFNTTDSNHNLRLTIYGNVTGTDTIITLPALDSPDWKNPNYTDGKIVNVTSSTDKETTLYSKADFLSYEPWTSTVGFCDQLINGTCPLGPAFDANA